MDAMLSGISVDGFKILAVVVALLVGVGVFFGFFRRWYWALFAAVFSYMVLTAGTGVYVLMHLNDPRWSVGKEPLLQAPTLSGAPVVGELMKPLEGFLRDAATSINELASFRHALPVAQEFFALAGWALLVLVPVTIVALVVSRFRQATLLLRMERMAAELAALKREVASIKPRGSDMPPGPDGH